MLTEYYRSKTNVAVKIVIHQHKIVIQKQMDGPLYFAEVKCNGSLYFAEDRFSDSCQVQIQMRLEVAAVAVAAYIRRLRAELAATKRDNDEFVAEAARDTPSQ